MEQEAKGSDRVAIDKDVHQLYKDLSERSSQNPETAPFLLMKDVFMWAVALGIKEGSVVHFPVPVNKSFAGINSRRIWIFHR